MDRRGLPGWGAVDRLAACLLASSGLALTHTQADRIGELWALLEPADRKALKFGGLPRRTQVRGRFHRRYRTGGYAGVEAMGRSVTAKSM